MGNNAYMGALENKQLLQHIFAELSQGNGKPLVDSMADDVVWRVAGATKWSRSFHGKRAVIKELLGPLNAQFAEPYKATAERIIAEGDYVVVESRGRVTVKSGKPYNNNYCFIYRIADGKIREITEYLDTELVSAVLEDPGAAATASS